MDEKFKKFLPKLIVIGVLLVSALAAGIRSAVAGSDGRAENTVSTASAGMGYTSSDKDSAKKADDSKDTAEPIESEAPDVQAGRITVNTKKNEDYGSDNTTQTIAATRTSRAYAMADNYIQWDTYELTTSNGYPDTGFGYGNDAAVVNGSISTVTLPDDTASTFYDSLYSYAFSEFDSEPFAEIIDDQNTAHTVKFIASSQMNSDLSASDMTLSTLINAFNSGSSYDTNNLKDLSDSDKVIVMKCQDPKNLGSWLYLVGKETASSTADAGTGN